MNTIGERLLYLREERDVSMNELEDSIGASRGSANKWEKGSIPGGKYLMALSDYYGVTTDWILKGETTVSEIEKQSFETEVSSKLDLVLSQLTPSDIEFIAKFKQLTEKEQGRIEERIDIYLSEHKNEISSKETTSSTSQNGGRREDAATKAG